MNIKRLVVFSLLATALAVGAIAAGGSLNDPLISKEYLDGNFRAALEKQADEKIAAHYGALNQAALQSLEQDNDALRTRLAGSQNTALKKDESYHALFLPEQYAYQDEIILREGTSLLLLEGTAHASVKAGELIDLTEGLVNSSSLLQTGHRYLAAEGASVTVSVQSEQAKIAVTGYIQTNAKHRSALPFTDINRESWYYSAISYVYSKKLFSGMSEDQFWPSYPVTRAMLATVLHRMAGSPQSTGSGSFSDIQAGSWYQEGVNWSASVQVVKGMEAGAFWPNYNVTREQLAVMLYRYAGEYLAQDVSKRGDLTQFKDAAQINSWAGEAMAWAVGSGILNGDDMAALRPGGPATRAEAATMIERFAGLIA